MRACVLLLAGPPLTSHLHSHRIWILVTNDCFRTPANLLAHTSTCTGLACSHKHTHSARSGVHTSTCTGLAISHKHTHRAHVLTQAHVQGSLACTSTCTGLARSHKHTHRARSHKHNDCFRTPANCNLRLKHSNHRLKHSNQRFVCEISTAMHSVDHHSPCTHTRRMVRIVYARMGTTGSSALMLAAGVISQGLTPCPLLPCIQWTTKV